MGAVTFVLKVSAAHIGDHWSSIDPWPKVFWLAALLRTKAPISFLLQTQLDHASSANKTRLSEIRGHARICCLTRALLPYPGPRQVHSALTWDDVGETWLVHKRAWQIISTDYKTNSNCFIECDEPSIFYFTNGWAEILCSLSFVQTWVGSLNKKLIAQLQ